MPLVRPRFHLGRLHSCLFQCLAAQHIEHWLDLLVEVKELIVTFINLSGFAILFRWHFWLEEWHWGSIQIELSGDALFPLSWLISEDLFVWLGLYVHVHSARHWLWSWNFTIWVYVSNSLGILYSFNN